MTKPSDDIDLSDIPATTEADWVGAVRGKFYRPGRGGGASPIILSNRDFTRFEEITSADAEPTELAVQEAAEFRCEVESGQIVLKDGERQSDPG